MKLPLPEKEALAHSNATAQVIAEEIKQHGPISFARYMQMALYQPGLGYYSAGATKFGRSGDFITAPELSPLFSQCVARQCQQVLANMNGVIFELGAGSGVMALEILKTLDTWNCLPEKYYILELSADLKQKQFSLFNTKAPQYLSQIEWLDRLPQTPLKGVVIANEVCDALPVHRFKIENTIKEYHVDVCENKFIWKLEQAREEIVEALNSLEVDFPAQYSSEINLLIKPWISSLSNILSMGILLLIDYGYTRSEYYHPERDMGTLLCHFRQRAHDDPFIYPGIQDITAFVDFTRIAEAAVISGLEVAGFTHQAAFLINCGLIDFANKNDNSIHRFTEAQQIKRLTLPGEMGERFKAIALSKNFSYDLIGFCELDQTDRL